jgi:hypothetical protein
MDSTEPVGDNQQHLILSMVREKETLSPVNHRADSFLAIVLNAIQAYI